MGINNTLKNNTSDMVMRMNTSMLLRIKKILRIQLLQLKKTEPEFVQIFKNIFDDICILDDEIEKRLKRLS